MTAAETRAICARCMRPTVVCFCHLVVPLETKTRVVILQHPRERPVPINTVRIASLCLPSAETHVGVRWDDTPVMQNILADQERPAALLYPGDDAVDVEQSPPDRPITLVVVDGTWWQARKVVRSSRALSSLPRYAFRPRVPSQYRIRSEPHEDCVSTIEAIAHVLGVLEGDRARFQGMLEPFRAMVDRQIEFAHGESAGRRFKRRRPPGEDTRVKLARMLREHWTRLVCVHAEINSWPYNAPERATYGEELVWWLATRVATGETFARFVKPRGPMAPSTMRHLQVDPAVMIDAVTPADLVEGWRAFTKPDDVVCSWGPFPLELFANAGGAITGERIDLRMWCRLREGGRVGTMEELLAREGVAVSAEGPGRGHRRLAELTTLARALSGT